MVIIQQKSHSSLQASHTNTRDEIRTNNA